LLLGGLQIVNGVVVNAVIVMIAGSLASFLARRPSWLIAQRWVMGTVLGGLAVNMATAARR
jgi:threonine/homoserine/homoserine lactone efflux protein